MTSALAVLTMHASPAWAITPTAAGCTPPGGTQTPAGGLPTLPSSLQYQILTQLPGQPEHWNTATLGVPEFIDATTGQSTLLAPSVVPGHPLYNVSVVLTAQANLTPHLEIDGAGWSGPLGLGGSIIFVPFTAVPGLTVTVHVPVSATQYAYLGYEAAPTAYQPATFGVDVNALDHTDVTVTAAGLKPGFQLLAGTYAGTPQAENNPTNVSAALSAGSGFNLPAPGLQVVQRSGLSDTGTPDSKRIAIYTHSPLPNLHVDATVGHTSPPTGTEVVLTLPTDLCVSIDGDNNGIGVNYAASSVVPSATVDYLGDDHLHVVLTSLPTNASVDVSKGGWVLYSADRVLGALNLHADIGSASVGSPFTHVAVTATNLPFDLSMTNEPQTAPGVPPTGNRLIIGGPLNATLSPDPIDPVPSGFVAAVELSTRQIVTPPSLANSSHEVDVMKTPADESITARAVGLRYLVLTNQDVVNGDPNHHQTLGELQVAPGPASIHAHIVRPDDPSVTGPDGPTIPRNLDLVATATLPGHMSFAMENSSALTHAVLTPLDAGSVGTPASPPRVQLCQDSADGNPIATSGCPLGVAGNIQLNPITAPVQATVLCSDANAIPTSCPASSAESLQFNGSIANVTATIDNNNLANDASDTGGFKHIAGYLNQLSGNLQVAWAQIPGAPPDAREVTAQAPASGLQGSFVLAKDDTANSILRSDQCAYRNCAHVVLNPTGQFEGAKALTNDLTNLDLCLADACAGGAKIYGSFNRPAGTNSNLYALVDQPNGSNAHKVLEARVEQQLPHWVQVAYHLPPGARDQHYIHYTASDPIVNPNRPPDPLNWNAPGVAKVLAELPQTSPPGPDEPAGTPIRRGMGALRFTAQAVPTDAQLTFQQTSDGSSNVFFPIQYFPACPVGPTMLAGCVPQGDINQVGACLAGWTLDQIDATVNGGPLDLSFLDLQQFHYGDQNNQHWDRTHADRIKVLPPGDPHSEGEAHISACKQLPPGGDTQLVTSIGGVGQTIDNRGTVQANIHSLAYTVPYGNGAWNNWDYSQLGNPYGGPQPNGIYPVAGVTGHANLIQLCGGVAPSRPPGSPASPGFAGSFKVNGLTGDSGSETYGESNDAVRGLWDALTQPLQAAPFPASPVINGTGIGQGNSGSTGPIAFTSRRACAPDFPNAGAGT